MLKLVSYLFIGNSDGDRCRRPLSGSNSINLAIRGLYILYTAVSGVISDVPQCRVLIRVCTKAGKKRLDLGIAVYNCGK